MGMIKRSALLAVAAAIIFGFGGLTAHKLPQIKRALALAWNGLIVEDWDDKITVVEIPTINSSKPQLAYAHLVRQEDLKPLVVSLHAWVDDYSSADPLSVLVANENWNYIHPDFQGPNWTKDACLSKKALSDIDAAIDYAIEHGSVDLNNIFIVGASGGGYATLGAYLRSKHQVKGFQSWVPISDLEAWFHQSSDRNYDYAEHILKCTSDGIKLDQQSAKQRSPLFWEIKGSANGKLDIYAGIRDGYTDSVPLSHSILFYNKLVLEYGAPDAAIDEADIIKLLTRGVPPLSPKKTIGGRDVLFSQSIPEVSITIFQGGHEILRDHVMLRLKQLYEQ
ncbi:prolyl oligopeptidase family serine peptidase [Granulosicoccus sp.]|nr:prolyl oligopeptidase family serine peptidase [Granulosicoccus sp.]MDB4223427.1 prolyl oligopeptidase family serine peptidase [Granulosicoccus sp.]